jgi:hypothetical protein
MAGDPVGAGRRDLGRVMAVKEQVDRAPAWQLPGLTSTHARPSACRTAGRLKLLGPPTSSPVSNRTSRRLGVHQSGQRQQPVAERGQRVLAQ